MLMHAGADLEQVIEAQPDAISPEPLVLLEAVGHETHVDCRFDEVEPAHRGDLRMELGAGREAVLAKKSDVMLGAFIEAVS
jgi:hypothetical protein